MDDDRFAVSADRILASLDFANAAAARDTAHRREFESVLRGMIEIVDALEALERKLQVGGGRNGARASLPTIRRVLRKSLGVLAKAGIEPIDCVGREIDLERSEVVDVRYDSDAAEDTVVEEIVRGYSLRQRPFRPAKVVIARDRDDDTAP